MKRSVMLMIAAMAVVMILASCLFLVKSSAHGSAQDRPRLYKSIEIAAGDTLWDISERYAEDLDMPVRDYVKELKRVNGMSSDRIIAGAKLIVICASEQN